MSPEFVSVALTGGIATGKSSFVRLLGAELPEMTIFDCDTAVHQLLTKAAVARRITASLGVDLAGSDGQLDKSRLRERVFHDQDSRRILEGILHPLVREECQLALQQAINAPGCRIFLMDVPLLYESAFPTPRDLEIVVACGPVAQRERLMTRNRIDHSLADRMIATQLPLAGKMAKAGVVIWNGGTPAALARQTTLFSTWLKSKLNP